MAKELSKRALEATKRQKEIEALKSKWFEGLNLGQIELDVGFSFHDLVVIFSQVPTEQHENLKEILHDYVEARETFFSDPENSESFKNYSDHLLTLIYPDESKRQEAIAQMDVFTKEHGEGRAAWANEKEPVAPKERGKQVYYQLYADFFTVNEAGETHGFEELVELLDYIKDLGCTHIWVLPPFESPGHDNGFDPSDRRKIMENLDGNEAFIKFIKVAAKKGITIKVDMVLNHLSYESEKFKTAIDPASPDYEKYKEWFHFEEGNSEGGEPDRYQTFWNIFGDMHMSEKGKEIFPEATGEPKVSNWTKVNLKNGRETYVLTRFKPQMPDLNYGNPEVLINELDVMRYWLDLSQEGMVLRYDALKHVWKMDKHDIEPEHLAQQPGLVKLIEDYKGDNLVQDRLIIFLLRAYALHRYGDHVDTVVEVWDSPEQILKYVGIREGDKEGGGFFDFETMDALLKTIHFGNNIRLHEAIQVLQSYPDGRLALTLLRHHDGMAGDDTGDDDFGMEELAKILKLSEETILELKKVYPDFDEENGLWFDGGWAVRLRDFLEAKENPQNDGETVELIKRAFMQLFYLASTPLFYMGDEFGETNNENHLLKQSIGKNGEKLGVDIREVHRALNRPIKEVLELLKDESTIEFKIHQMMKQLIALRKGNEVLSNGKPESMIAFLLDKKTGELVEDSQVFAAYKEYRGSDEAGKNITEFVVMLSNLTSEVKTTLFAIENEKVSVKVGNHVEFVDLVTEETVTSEIVELNGKLYFSFELNPRQSWWLVFKNEEL